MQVKLMTKTESSSASVAPAGSGKCRPTRLPTAVAAPAPPAHADLDRRRPAHARRCACRARPRRSHPALELVYPWCARRIPQGTSASPRGLLPIAAGSLRSVLVLPLSVSIKELRGRITRPRQFSYQVTFWVHDTMPVRRKLQLSGNIIRNARLSVWNSDRCGDAAVPGEPLTRSCGAVSSICSVA